jgi:hypothetical protein
MVRYGYVLRLCGTSTYGTFSESLDTLRAARTELLCPANWEIVAVFLGDPLLENLNDPIPTPRLSDPEFAEP